MNTPSEVAVSDDFAATLVHWQRLHGRHDLPWQTGDAYGVWVSEIMLQQTQVQTVIGYYGRFIERFPTLAALAFLGSMALAYLAQSILLLGPRGLLTRAIRP